MRTIDFSQVLFDALQYSGNDRHNITAETFAQFRDFISARLREVWESNDWPDVCVMAYFTTSQDANGVTYFTPASEAGEIIGVYNRNPHATTKATNLNYSIFNDSGTQKVALAGVVADGWYLYRKQVPKFTGDVYSPSTVYFNDVQVYFDSGSGTGAYTPVAGKPHYGNFYTCVTSSTSAGQNPNSHASYWSKSEIPYVFGAYLAWSAAANWFVSEGMMQEAAVVEGKAKELLELEYDKVLRQQNQFGRINMSQTY